MMAVNHFTPGQAAFSVDGYAFPLARLVADGQAVSYLREACPQRRYALCEYIDCLPKDSDEFLWSPDSPFRKVGCLPATAGRVERSSYNYHAVSALDSNERS